MNRNYRKFFLLPDPFDPENKWKDCKRFNAECVPCKMPIMNDLTMFKESEVCQELNKITYKTKNGLK
jgi:hypothetical protein